MIKNFLIKSDFIDSRLDRWLRKNICDVPQSLIEKNIRKGKIKVNNKREKSSYKLQKNDQVLIYNINFSENKNRKKTIPYEATKKEILSSTEMIIENNENFVVINKPAGIAVQSGTKSRRNILDLLKSTKEFDGVLPYTVHRIDKETTGILIVAKNRKYAQLFTSLFRIRKINKTYLGIVSGQLQKTEGTLIDDLHHYDKKKKIITRAVTHFKVLDSNGKFSLIKLNPETGRKHQLRKQLLLCGHPIIGDDKYKLFNKNSFKKNTLMLHAFKINFSIDGAKYKFLARLPIVFEKFLNEKYLKNFEL